MTVEEYLQFKEEYLQFTPSKVDGFPNVNELKVSPICLKLLSDEQWHIFYFSDMARWPRPAWFWRFLARLRLFSFWIPVGERDWFHPPAERFIRFYTKPQITIFMPIDDAENYFESYFWRTQLIIIKGGFQTFDLG